MNYLAKALIGAVAWTLPMSAALAIEPTPVKVPAKMKVGVVTCFSVLRGCVAPAEAIKKIGDARGWDVTIYDGGGTAQKQNAAMLDAISAGSNLVVGVAVPPQLVQLALQQAKKDNVLVVSGSTGTDTPNDVWVPAEGGLDYAVDVSPDYVGLGKKTADWIIKDSGGKANVAVFSENVPSVMAFQKGLLEGLKTCTGCTVSEVQYFTGSQVGTTLGQQTVGYLRNHPETDYLFSPYDPAAADQVTAISQAGMGTQVKIVSVLGTQQNINFIRNGRVQAADAAYDNTFMGYAILDQAFRIMAGQPVVEPHGYDLPTIVLDKTNLPAPGGDWVADTGYADKFEAAWQKQE